MAEHRRRSSENDATNSIDDKLDDKQTNNDKEEDSDDDDDVPLSALDKQRESGKTKIGNKNKVYECKSCKTSFESLKKYKSHKRVAHGKRKKLKNKTDSGDNVSDGENKIFSCSACNGREFKSKLGLVLHLKYKHSTTTAEERHRQESVAELRCDTCHRAFPSAVQLAAHAARHDLEGKPYACFVCSIGYGHVQSLHKHLRTVHRGEDVPRIATQYLCTLCGEVFESREKLNRHLKESHVVIAVGEIRMLEDDCEE